MVGVCVVGKAQRLRKIVARCSTEVGSGMVQFLLKVVAQPRH